MRIVFLAAIAMLLAAADLAAQAPTNPGRKQPIRFQQLRDGFAQPDMLYAPFAFWFWDEPLSTEKMAGMAAKMARVGMNPGYAHARMSMVGTPSLPDDQWLGDAWFSAFSASLGEAEKQKAYLGYCDEYWWPSFQAHGRVLKQHPELKSVSLAWRTIDVPAGKTVDIPACVFATAARRVDPIAALKPEPPQPRLGRWIWCPDVQPVEHTCWLRRRFEVPAGRTVRAARIKVTCDNAFRLWLDGKPLGESDDWHIVREYDVAQALGPGAHVLAAEARNVDGGYGFTLGLMVDTGTGPARHILTDGDWRATLGRAEGWEQPGFDDSKWRQAAVIAEPGAAPWSLQPEPGEVHRPTTIVSTSLRVLGAGKAFRWTAPAGSDWRVYAYTLYDHPGVDGGQVNCIDPRLAPAFIEIALEPYARRLGDKLGSTIPGDFIDHEGAFGWRLAWSDALAARYRARYGADLRAHLPLMADVDAEGFYAAARWRWYDTVSELYSGQFAAVTAWHERRGMSTTAHVWEESMQAQVYAVGDHMRLLRSLTMPGQDCLATKALQVHDFKEIESVAEFGGRRAATELMGAGGWGVMTSEFLKQSINATTAWGMGHVIPHAVFAQRKMTGNPWAPDFYEENPMFPYLRVWTDFIRRTSYVNSHGAAVPNVLLYNPIESLWTLADANLLHAQRNLPGLVWTWPEDNPNAIRANAIDRAYSKAIQDLTDGRVEFLIGDRHYVNGMQARDGRLTLGSFSFGAVVLPPLEVLPREVARKLASFVERGGRIYALGELPRASAELGLGDPEMSALVARIEAAPTFSRCPAAAGQPESEVTTGIAASIRAGAPGLESPVRFVSGEFPMLQRRMRADGRDLFWLANNTGKPQACRLQFRGVRGEAEAWDCETGAIRPLGSSEGPTGSELNLGLGPYEGVWVVFDPTQPARAIKPAPEPRPLLTVEGPWRVSLDPAIQPVLEHPVAVPADIRAGVEKPLEDWSRWLPAAFSGVLDYTTTVRLPALTGTTLLDLGTVHHVAEVIVNGKSCGARIWAPYVYDITAAVHAGDNEVRVRVANLVNNNYGDPRPSGLKGPVRVLGQ